MRHCELNPIELIWAQVKRYEAFRNSKMKDVLNLTHEALAYIASDALKKAADRVISIEDRLCAYEGIIEAIPY